MAYAEKYLPRYDYVPFKNNWYVDCRPKKQLLKNSVVDVDALSELSLFELQQVVNPRNVEQVEKIIKQKIKEQEQLLKASQQFDYAKKKEKKQLQEQVQERAKIYARKRTMQLLNGIAGFPNYSRIYA